MVSRVTAFGAVMFLGGLLAVITGVIWLIGAAIRSRPKKLPTMIAGGGVAALFLGIIVVGISETSSNSSLEDQGATDPQATAAADVPEPMIIPTAEVLPSGERALSGAAFIAMTEEEFEAFLRQEFGLSDQQVEERMATFHQDKATAVARQDRLATPVPRDWTAEELLACDPKDRKYPDLMSDCEVALYLAQIAGSSLYESDSELRKHAASLSTIDSVIDGLMEDLALTPDEGAYLCEVREQWEGVVRDAAVYVASLASSDTLGFEVEILRVRMFLDEAAVACN